MGYYRIVIEGTGCHHNGPTRADEVGDADHLARKLVNDLLDKGHHIHAQYTTFALVQRPGGEEFSKEPLIVVTPSPEPAP